MIDGEYLTADFKKITIDKIPAYVIGYNISLWERE
jgi:hypothetical protein